jgi:hypothetical protein
MQGRTNLSANIQFRVPPALVAALAEGADRDCTTASAFIRACIVGRLRELGVSINSDHGKRDRGGPHAAAAAG